MLGISTGYRIDAKDGAAWILHVEGRLQGEWVEVLRRQWRRLRSPDDVRIRVELDDVEFVDRTGRLLLAEMQEAGVQVAWQEAGSRPAVPEAVARSTASRTIVTR